MLGIDFSDLVADGVNGIERRHRLLKHHADVTPTDFRQLLFRQAEQILLLIANVACEAHIGIQTHDALCQHGFATARFAHYGHFLPCRHRQIHTKQHLFVAKIGIDLLHRQQHCHEHPLIVADFIAAALCLNKLAWFTCEVAVLMMLKQRNTIHITICIMSIKV